jgi:hypothetical protein
LTPMAYRLSRFCKASLILRPFPLPAPVTDPVVDVIAPVADPVTNVIAPITDPVASAIAPAIDPVTEVVAPVTDTLGPVIDPITHAAPPLLETITTVPKEALERATGQSISEALAEIVDTETAQEVLDVNELDATDEVMVDEFEMSEEDYMGDGSEAYDDTMLEELVFEEESMVEEFEAYSEESLLEVTEVLSAARVLSEAVQIWTGVERRLAELSATAPHILVLFAALVFGALYFLTTAGIRARVLMPWRSSSSLSPTGGSAAAAPFVFLVGVSVVRFW